MDTQICLPVFLDFDCRKPVGYVVIDRYAVPDSPDWDLALGYRVTETGYDPISMGLVTGKTSNGCDCTSNGQGH